MESYGSVFVYFPTFSPVLKGLCHIKLNRKKYSNTTRKVFDIQHVDRKIPVVYDTTQQ